MISQCYVSIVFCRTLFGNAIKRRGCSAVFKRSTTGTYRIAFARPCCALTSSAPFQLTVVRAVRPMIRITTVSSENHSRQNRRLHRLNGKSAALRPISRSEKSLTHLYENKHILMLITEYIGEYKACPNTVLGTVQTRCRMPSSNCPGTKA